MNFLLDEWMDEGEIECRDMGPYRCLISFSSVEIKNRAMEDELLKSIFDEIRPHWDFCGALPRLDDRIEELKSFSTARVLMDSFQWEMIHEWVTLRVDDRIFDVFVKEWGSEVYSVQAHPNLMEELSESIQDDGGAIRLVVDVSPAYSDSGLKVADVNSKKVDVVDPLIEVIINKRLGGVLEFNCGGRNFGEENGTVGVDLMSASRMNGQWFIEGVRGGLLQSDPAVWEAYVTHNIELCIKEGVTGPVKNDLNLSLRGYDNSTTSAVEACECEDWVVHSTVLEAVPITQIVSATQLAKGTWEATASSSSGVLVCRETNLDSDAAVGEDRHSGEALYRINYEAVQWDRSVVNPSIVVAGATAEGLDAVVNREESVDFVDEEEFSDETMYLINEDNVERFVNGEILDEPSLPQGFSDETLYLINEENVGNFMNGELLKESSLPQREDAIDEVDDESVSAVPNTNDLTDLCEEGNIDSEEWESVEEDDNSAEILVAKEIRCRAGLFIGSSEEEEIHSKLVRQKKVEGKRRPDLRPKEQRQGKKPPCIQGRSFATRKLMSGTKPKLR
ncbi:hypothetical protein PIB30_008944 [Stylosanthes scabra]|uniref:Uncharacterized protein n=1 Tax=Stylosanthes scabra TaxID=79078 RepID=A0ABU6R6B6_9FABA|nr:hypothetical protein [Stylosanthes scabra]